MAALAVKKDTFETVDLRADISDGMLLWSAPDDGWTIMFFSCVMSTWDHVNYLDPAAVGKFIEVTHEPYFAAFGADFGGVIDSSFYDEPQMYAVGGRMWTDDFNDRFREKYHEDPDTLYPALWYDIGEKTASARNKLLGLRADMYAKGFPRVINDWCQKHGIRLTGHVDQEEMINPCGITGDLMKSFQYQDMPGYDEISYPGRGRRIYKLVTSAAYNWDKPLVMSECFGAMPASLTIETMYDEAMEQYAKGMNLLVPHAVWLDPRHDKIIFHPELSAVNPLYQGVLQPFNEFCARVQSLLQGGVHRADIAVLYPINGLQSAYYFDWGGDPYLGGPAPSWADYQEVGDILSTQARRDFTYLHPEVLEKRCHI
ncbi:MAG: hypothetical protein MJ175_08945, partial [Clostridia bacterium]|nr:hypothetical protein [Clostridia bacterium]